MTDAAVVAPPPPAPPPAKGVKAWLIQCAFALMIGAAAGAAFETTRPPPAVAKGGEAPAVASAATVLDLAPIVTNLGAPSDVWVRLETSIVFDPKILPHPEVVAARIGDDILAYLRTVTLKQLEGPIGLESIRQDFNERAATRSEGKVREVVIRTLVVQ